MSRFFNGLRERLKSKLIHNAFLFAVNHSQARVLKEFVGKTRPRQEVVWNEAEFEHVCNFMTLAAVPGASAFGSFTNNNAVSISLSLRDHCGPPNPAELAKQYVHISTHLVFPSLLFIHAHTHTRTHAHTHTSSSLMPAAIIPEHKSSHKSKITNSTIQSS